MPRQMTYTNSINKTLTFWGDKMLFNYGDIRSHKWSYSKGYNKIKTFSRGITSHKFTVLIYSDAFNTANTLFNYLDYDVVTQQAGKLKIGQYYMKGYVTEITPTQKSADVISCSITFVTDEPFWIKETTTHYITQHEGNGLDYPHDFEYDYTNALNINVLNNDSYVPSDFRIVIFGAIENPSLTIAGHSYTVNADIEAGEYLTIDSYNKTIYKTENDGTQVNLFDKRDKDSYIFQKMPIGSSSISWAEEAIFDITLIEQRSEPKWT